MPLVTWIAWKHGSLWWAVPFAVLAPIAALNWRLFRLKARGIGWAKALLCFPLLLIHRETCVLGLLFGLAKAEHRRDKFLWPACALIGLVLLGIQLSGGAFTAEFTGHPDEPAQFVSGLMMYDYLAALPGGNPLAWAGNYYLHYPEVAIGHWPPAYHMMEALWWLVWGPSRATAMWLQWSIGLVAMTVLYRLGRAFLPLPAAALIVALTIATPVFQESLQETMADLCCLLWSVLFMHAAVRFLEKRDRTSLSLLGFWLAAAAMTKGTAVCLVPVAVVVLLVSRTVVQIPVGWILAAGAGLLAAAAWYVWMGDVRAWGGMSASVPWPGRLIGHLAGWGALALAALGLRRTPLALVSAGIVASTLGSSLVLRAMREQRHWIIALPAILVLAGFAISRFHRPAIGAILLLPALVFFPWSRFHQTPTGFGDLLRQVPVPSRMLVSSTGVGEGAWIAVAGVTEKRPGSFIVRATKVLSESGWNGEGYHLLTATPETVGRRIDELALDLVVLHSPPNRSAWPHHALLRNTMQDNAAWKECGHARDLLAYCRVLAPRIPRQPLKLRVAGMDLEETITASQPAKPWIPPDEE
jgi:hypothetical protein